MKKATPTYNFAVIRPDLAMEWHPRKNGKLTPRGVLPYSHIKIWWRCKKGHEWQDRVADRNRYVSKCPGCNGKYKKKIFQYNCLAFLRPDLAREWHPKKNGNLTPRDIRLNSSIKVWWRCKKGHEWQATVSNRNNTRGCPYCSGRRVCDDNCLQTINPSLAKEWHPTKNGELTPKDVMPYSNKKFWWRCKKCGHEWQARISSRALGAGCRKCYIEKQKDKRFATKKYNLAVVNPTLAREWHPTRNDRTPRDVTPGSDYMVWWRCKKCGHEWRTTVGLRNRGTGCRECAIELAKKLNSTRKVTSKNNLKVNNPKLIQEWHPTKNDRTPRDVTPWSSYKAWWKCKKCGYEWPARVYERNLGNKKCSRCNSFAMRRPDLIQEWHPTLNDRTPSDVTPGSDYMAQWICKRGHVWKMRVAHRVNDAGCPYCAGQKVCKDNCLATKNPTLAAEWHPTKNDRTPSEVTAHSSYKAWWRCNWYHEWQATVDNRSKGKGCRECWKRIQKGLRKDSAVPKF